MNDLELQSLKNRVLSGGEISLNEAQNMIVNAQLNTILDAADEIRKQFAGNLFDMCSITNAKSGQCSEDCKWCAQSAFHKSKIEKYELIPTETAVDNALNNSIQGIKRFSLVTSGRTVSQKSLSSMIKIYQEIKSKSDISLCASMGLLSKEQLQQLKDTGIEHYHCNLETAPSFFAQMVTTHSFDEKINTIKDAQACGLKICSGGILGLGETPQQRVELAFALADLNVNSIPLNVLNSIEGTKLESQKLISEEEVLRAIAVFRFINPKANIRFAGGRNLLSKNTQMRALKGGINSALVGDYLTTIGTNVYEDKKMFADAGFEVNF